MVTKKTTISIVGGLVLLVTAAALTSAPPKRAYSEISDGRGGTNVEATLLYTGDGF